MDDLGIRNNIIGLQIGAIPTISKACNHAMEEVVQQSCIELRPALRRPQARSMTINSLSSIHMGSTALQPPPAPNLPPCACATRLIAPSTLRRSRTIPKETMVMAVSLAATFDNLDSSRCQQFSHRPTVRSLHDLGLRHAHLCFGAAHKPTDHSGHS